MAWFDTWQRAAERVDDQPIQWNAALTPAELIECLLFALEEHADVDDIIGAMAQEFRLRELVALQDLARMMDDETMHGTDEARAMIRKARALGEVVRTLDNAATNITLHTT